MARPSEDIGYDVSSLKEKEPIHDDFDTGNDIGKNSCSVVGVDDKGVVIVLRTMRRQTLIEFASKMPTCVLSVLRRSPSWPDFRRARTWRPADVARICPPQCEGVEERDRDAEGIAEAASRLTMRFVDLKTEEPLDIQSLHRVRSRLVALATE